MLQFQRIPTVLAMLQHHTPNQQPKSSKIEWTCRKNGWSCQEVYGQSWNRRETTDFRFIQLQSYTTVRQHCITTAITNTVHTQGKELTSTSQCTRCPRNAPNLPGTHQEARQQTRKKLHRIGPRFTSLSSAQAECYMETSNSGKPMCTKLLLDNAGKWYRAT